MDVKLVIFKRDGQRKDFSILHDNTVIGRAEDCSLRIPLPSVSRRHCELVKTGGELKVRDLASSNGTYVNNRRVTEATLKAGDRLLIGPVVFTVQIDGAPEEIKPVKPQATVAAAATGAQEDEIVDLEADVIAAEEDSDPIAALEALASEQPEQQEDQGEEGKG